MVKGYRFHLFLGVLLLAQSSSFGEDVRATARVDSNNILIGDWLKLHVDIQHLPNVTVTFPVLPDSFEGFEVVQRENPSVKKTDQAVLESTTFTVTAFDSGMHIIPPLIVYYTVAGDTTKRTTGTSPIPILVHGVAIDTTQEIKDVKPPLSVPISFAEILPYLIGIVVVSGVVWLIYYIRKKRKLGESFLPEEPPRPAHEMALEALRALGAEHLWQRGKIKEYHSEITDIVRIYIGLRFKILAMEMTTDEILKSEIIERLQSEIRQLLREILVKADFVKFAKFQPLPTENEASLTSALSFVEATWRQVPEVPTQTVTEEAAV